ncbi:MAG: helix-turn-helix domain-containing protein [Desulfomonilaceae bacterium]
MTLALPPEQVADFLNIKVRNVHRLVRNGKLDCIKLDAKNRRFTKEQVEEFVQRMSTGTPRPVDTSAPKDVPFPRKKGGSKSTSHGADDLTSIVEEVRKWH